MRKHSTADYTADWPEIAKAVKAKAGGHCVRCGFPSSPGRVLTVHHLDMNPSNNAWWNLAALCQVCHLQIQAKVNIWQAYMFDLSTWFKPYVAGYYAHELGLPDDESWVREHLEPLLRYGRGVPYAGANCCGNQNH